MTTVIEPKVDAQIIGASATNQSGSTNIVPPLPPELTIYAASFNQGIAIYSAPELVLQPNPLQGVGTTYLGIAIDDNFENLVAVGDNQIDSWNLNNNLKLNVSGTQPDNPRCCTFNRAGDVVAVGGSGAPQFRLYSFPDLSDIPAPSINSQVDDVRYNNDDSFFACAASTGDRIRVFNTFSSPPTQIANPSNTIVGQTLGCDFTPDGTKLAQAAFSSPWMRAWQSVGETPWQDIPDPASLPETLADAVRFHPTQNILAVGSQGGTFLSFYSFSVDDSQFIRLADPDVSPSSAVLSLNWNHNGNLLVVVTSGSPYLFLYDTSSLPYVLIGSPDVITTDIQEAVFRFNPR